MSSNERNVRGFQITTRPYHAINPKSSGRLRKNVIKLVSVFTMIRELGGKDGRRKRSRCVKKRCPAPDRELLNQVHGSKALKTNAG
jgi:hypothetical protein